MQVFTSLITEKQQRFLAADGEFRLVHFASSFHGLVDDCGNEISAEAGDRKWVTRQDAEKVHARGRGVIIASRSRDVTLRQLGAKRWV